MKKVLEKRRSFLVVFLIFLLVSLLITGAIGISYAGDEGDDGIGEPADGLQSEPPDGTGGTSSYLDYLILFEALNLVL